MFDLSTYIFDALRKDEEFILYRGRNKDDGSEVLVLSPVAQSPTAQILRRLEHEYSFREALDPTWAAQPIAMARHWGRTVLVLQHPGGAPLDRCLSPPLDLGFWLRLAIGLSSAIDQLHEHGIIHKDIKPANVLVDSSTGQCWLMGFGIASRLPRERQSAEPPEFIAGTLAYMAPEQTGRMNRSIDSRSDLYSLGITLYEMLTGSLPFSASDPMEWVHCHIARQPIPPSERLKQLPATISAILLKLLAKTAEERYQTAAGAASDLQRCLVHWETHGRIDEFPLGEQDRPDRLLIPEKLYGRAREIDALLGSFDRVVASGRPELVLVSGYPGIGKSSLVNELHKVLVPSRGLFASGKFDQYKRDIPYATVAQALQSLIRSLLGKSEVELRDWRDAFGEALGPNGLLMVDLVPELKFIIGEQPPAPEFSPQAAQRRFQLVFQRFISVFARPEHPLVLFLDDLQWLDAATLDLLEALLSQSDVQHLMLIGAYRDNEVNSGHPLMRKLEVICQAGARVQEIILGPLACEDLGLMIGDSLRCEPERVFPLARLVDEKTAGNPFFVIQFISALVEERLLTFDHGGGTWCWDLSRIQAKGYTDNVVDLMIGKLNRLPVETQTALQEFACLGNRADITTLSILNGSSEEKVHSDLWEALRLEFIVCLEGSYKFVHDRVQEAAYSLIPEELRAATHLRIGRLLLAHTSAERREEAIFEIVSHFNRGAALITSQEERDQVAELNLIAGKRAKASTAYLSALKYLATGAVLLSDDSWERRHELTFALELNRAECEFLSGEPLAAAERLTMLSSRAASPVEQGTVASLRVDLYTTLDQSDSAVAVLLDYLRYLGVEWSPHPSEEEARREYERIWQSLGRRAIEELIDLPMMSDPPAVATVDVLIKALPAAWFTDANLYSLTLCRAVNLSLEKGNSDGSCVAYVCFPIIAGPKFDNYQAGFRFGQLGYELVEKRGLRRFQARTYLWFGQFVIPWTNHVQAGRDLMRRAFDAANKIGDLSVAAYSCHALVTNLLAAGDPLAEVQLEAENGLEFAQKARFGFIVDTITAQLGLIRTLRGLTPKIGSFDGGQFDKLRFKRHLENDPGALPECLYWILELQARFFAGDYASAVDASLAAQQLLWSAPSFFEVAEWHYYGALSHAACCDSESPNRHGQNFEALIAHHRQLKDWAENCPENFENRAALVDAEIARLEGRDFEAMRLYQEAIRSARANGFIPNEAVANELAARFYAARGFEEIAQPYLRNARRCYLSWGAYGKVRQLDELHPRLGEQEGAPGPTSTIDAPVEQLDLATVMKVSQAVSGEMILERLIDRLMRAAIEYAGAERGLLILSPGVKQWIAAEATISGDSIEVRLGEAPARNASRSDAGGSVAEAAVPESIVHYVVRTQQSVILDNASAQNPFSADAYIRQHHARSILCLPLIKQAKLIGVLYLENNLAPHVFTPSRIAVLKLLASQAAMSLENTRLYQDLEEREAKIRRLVDANIMGVFFWNFEGEILEANEAFLQMIGQDPEDLVSGRLRWTDLTPPEWRNKSDLPELKSTGIAQPFEKEYFRKDGRRVPVLVGAATFERNGNEGVAFVLDLSEQKRAEEERKRAEEALRVSEERWSQLAENSSAGIAQLAQDGRFIAANLALQKMLGYTEEELQARTTVDITHQEDRASTEARLEKVHRRQREVYRVEKRYLRKDGSIMWCDLSAVFVPASGGNSAFFSAVFIDLTERKRVEEALQKAQADLAHMTRMVTLGELTASIAHEINQPLGAVVNNASACLRWLSAQNLKEARQSAALVIADADRAGKIIHRIRALANKAPPQKGWLNLNETIREVIAMMRDAVQRNRVLLQTELSNDLPLILADGVQLQQVILNLLINGIEALSGAGEGPRELRISSHKVYEIPNKLQEDRFQSKAGPEAQYTHVLIAVRDSGPGLDPNSLGRLFDAFYTTKPQGLGIGLAISRSIVEAHGGQLWATANTSRGAVFQFVLPIHEER